MTVSQDRQRSIEELIARTPAAMPVEMALKAIADRKARLLSGGIAPLPSPPVIAETDPAEREPMPLPDDTEAFATGFWQRLKDKENEKKGLPPPRGSKPRLVVDNDNPPPPEKR